jgi:hypothetical protein
MKPKLRAPLCSRPTCARAIRHPFVTKKQSHVTQALVEAADSHGEVLTPDARICKDCYQVYRYRHRVPEEEAARVAASRSAHAEAALLQAPARLASTRQGHMICSESRSTMPPYPRQPPAVPSTLPREVELVSPRVPSQRVSHELAIPTSHQAVPQMPGGSAASVAPAEHDRQAAVAILGKRKAVPLSSSSAHGSPHISSAGDTHARVSSYQRPYAVSPKLWFVRKELFAHMLRRFPSDGPNFGNGPIRAIYFPGQHTWHKEPFTGVGSHEWVLADTTLTIMMIGPLDAVAAFWRGDRDHRFALLLRGALRIAVTESTMHWTEFDRLWRV